jgi:hypothetical protein
MKFVGTLCLLLTCGQGEARTVTITTDAVRRDVDGNYVDAHDGKIVVSEKIDSPICSIVKLKT